MEDIIRNQKLQKDLGDGVQDMVLSRLQDIEGLDSASWWPLAPGWWFILIIIGLIIVFYLRHRAYKHTWQYKTSQELEQMRKSLNSEVAPEIIIRLSEILRRIAIHKYSRAECAGLEGDSWLEWLTQKDKSKFNWGRHGRLLTRTAYAPVGKEEISLQELSRLIDATREWIK